LRWNIDAERGGSMFKKIKMEGKYWGVFLVSTSDPQDRYLMTAPLDSERHADHLLEEFERLICTGGVE
jgi:hypothetical protein